MMSTQMSQKSTDVVFGYSRSFDGSIPFEIINLCTAYFNVGEEFDTQRSTLAIEGANHTICRCTNPSKNGTFFGYNLISGSRYTYYHWRFLVKTLKNEPIKNTRYRFGISNDESEEVLHAMDVKYNHNDHETILDFYVFFAGEEGVCLVISSDRGSVEEVIDIDINKEYRLAVAGNDAVSIEILEFHSANCIPEKSEDLENLALAMPWHIDKKIELFEMVIEIDPRSFTYVEEYIGCLIKGREYSKAFYAVLYYHGRRYIPIHCIINIINHINGPGFRRKKNKLFELIDDEIDGILEDVSNGLKEFDEAIKYLKLSFKYTQEEEVEVVISICLPQVAQLYHNAKQYKKAYDLILEHKDSEYLSVEYILQTADALFRKKWYQDADRLFCIATYKDKYLTDCFISIKADAYYELGDFESAARYFAFRLKNAESEDVVSFCLERLRSIHHFIETQRPKNRENLKLCTMISKTILENKPDCKTKHTQIRMTR